ncbi:hypothetical protein EB796_015114 [Bugula neritina]|uniref:Uncharacterized protein n=1 Tax=Bugula neritina TaxID=10212 RepID=A0A7J7JL45_BUGNE|nr:hypothetical protein EB796_015114 [Bugula neritina]
MLCHILQDRTETRYLGYRVAGRELVTGFLAHQIYKSNTTKSCPKSHHFNTTLNSDSTVNISFLLTIAFYFKSSNLQEKLSYKSNYSV